MSLLLYLIVAGVTLLAWRRWVTRVSVPHALVILLLPFLFTGKALVTNRVYGGYDILFLSAPFSDYANEYGFMKAHNGLLLDHVLQMVPWQREVRESFVHHRWPLWNPAMDSGEVLAAGMQAAPLNPINLIALLLPLDLATTFTATMVFFLAALFTFAFARELECSEGASLIAAAAFTLCGGMAFFGTWPHGRSWGVLPFVLLSVRRVPRNRDAAAFGLLTIALVLLIVFGHPETILHVVTIGAIYGLFELMPAWREALRPMALALAAGILALLLTAISLMPFLAVLPWSFDYRIRQNPPLPATAHEIVKAMRATFLPYYGGASWHTPTGEWDFGLARVGSIALALAAIAAFRLWLRRDVRFFAILAVIAFVASWKAPPIDSFLRLLPLFKIAFNDRLGFAAALSLSLLAAMAFDAVAPKIDRVMVLIVTIALAVPTIALWKMQLSLGVDPKLLIAGAAAELIGIAILLATLGTRSRAVAAAFIVAFIAAQRFVEDGNIHPTLPRRMFYPSVPLIAAVPREPLYRFTAIDNMVIPNVATMYGLEDIRGYSAMIYYPYVETMPLWSAQKRTYHDVADLSLPFLNFLGVRDAITPRTMDPPPGWRVIADDRTSRLMENAHALPRIFVPRRIRFTDSDDTTLKEMAVATDFAEEAWLRGTPRMVENGEATLNVRRSGARYDIDIDARSDCRIVIVEVGWPGWRAFVDRERVSIAQANRAFLAISVPKGRHRVRVEYLPDAYVQGRAISIGTLALLGFGLIVKRFGSRGGAETRRKNRFSPPLRGSA
ncbi:MAG: hypothetical protein QOE82_1552 [Thermoanaerobaculia bacterium]|nr:hypothetical protein [Thermoanaerobaculia bacterium]